MSTSARVPPFRRLAKISPFFPQKQMKKIVALVLALVMVLSLATVAFAAPPSLGPGGEGGPEHIDIKDVVLTEWQQKAMEVILGNYGAIQAAMGKFATMLENVFENMNSVLTWVVPTAVFDMVKNYQASVSGPVNFALYVMEKYAENFETFIGHMFKVFNLDFFGKPTPQPK